MKQAKRLNSIVLSKRQFNEVSAQLAKLAAKLHVSALFMVNSSGQIIARKVRDRRITSATLATLAASTYSAGTEMARILGERNNFKMVLHEGVDKNVFVSSITKDYFLIVVFKKGVATGMVRIFTRKTIEELKPLVSPTDESEVRMEKIIDRQFQILLNDKLDALGE